MLVLAVSKKNKEFLYRYDTAHKVSRRCADAIMNTLNNVRYLLQDGEVWAKHEVSEVDNAFAYASYKSFKIKKGAVIEYRHL